MADRTYDFRELKTRIILRNDTASNWSSSTIVLEKGEPAVELDLTNKIGRIKFGDGTSTFSQLPFSTLTPSEIESLIAQLAVTNVKTGTGADGTITITKNGTDTAVAVKGLKSAAYTDSTDYATAAQGTKADNAMPKAGGTFTGTVTLAGAPTADLQAATKKYVDDKIRTSMTVSDALVFKGTVGTNGTVSNIASIPDPITGDTYKVITASTLTSAQSEDSAAHDLSIGDLIIYTESGKWAYVPSGDEDVTSIKIASGAETPTVNTTSQTGSIILGTAAASNTASTVTNDATTVPTTSAVKSYVDTAVGNVNSTEVILHNGSNSINVNDTTASTGTVVFGTAAGVDTTSSLTVTNGTVSGSTTLPTGSAVATAINSATEINSVTSVASATNVYLAGVYTDNTKKRVTDTGISATRDNNGNITKLNTRVTNADTADKVATAMSIQMVGAATGSTSSSVTINGTSQSGNGTDGSTNSGAFKIAVTSINTDYLTNGDKTLILNGGTATE